MVPPPSAVTQPSRQTPTQSMLRRPAASAAVIAWAASATSERMCSTVSLGGMPHIFPSRSVFSARHRNAFLGLLRTDEAPIVVIWHGQPPQPTRLGAPSLLRIGITHDAQASLRSRPHCRRRRKPWTVRQAGFCRSDKMPIGADQGSLGPFPFHLLRQLPRRETGATKGLPREL